MLTKMRRMGVGRGRPKAFNSTLAAGLGLVFLCFGLYGSFYVTLSQLPVEWHTRAVRMDSCASIQITLKCAHQEKWNKLACLGTFKKVEMTIAGFGKGVL